MTIYPGFFLSTSDAQDFCARQGSGGMLVEPKTEDQIIDLNDALTEWTGDMVNKCSYKMGSPSQLRMAKLRRLQTKCTTNC